MRREPRNRFCPEFAVLALMAVSVVGAKAQVPDWEVPDPAAYDASMSMTAVAFLDGLPSLHPENMLAAFHGEDLRGVSKATYVGADALFFLTIFGDTGGPTQQLTFKIYDAVLGEVRDSNESIEFVADHAIGELDRPLSLSAGSMGENRPTWAVAEPGTFETNMSVTASVFFDGVPGTHPGNLAAAFVGGELRAVASPTWMTGRQIFFLSVLGNIDGETVSFRMYDAATGLVRTAVQSLSYGAAASVGSVEQPYQLVGGDEGANRPDWQVAGAELFEHTMSIAAMVSVDGTRSNHAGDLIAALSGIDIRGVASPRWVNGAQMFFVTIFGGASTGAINFAFYDAASDRVVDINEEVQFEADRNLGSVQAPLALTSGSTGVNAPTWSVETARYGLSMSVVGTLVIGGEPNVHPASRIGAFVGEELRGVAAPRLAGGRSLYFLSVYANGVGESITFRAYDGVTDRIRGVDFPVVFDSDGLVGSISAPYVWKTVVGAQRPSWQGPDSTAFSLQMTVVGSLLINDEASTHPDNIVAAFAGSELRGIAVPTVVDGHLVFVMTVFANAGGETIRFEAYDAAADRVRPVLETLTFSAGEVVGTPSSPLALTTSVDAPQASPALLAPSDGEVDVQLEPTLVWDTVPRATSYDVELAISEDFSGAIAFGGVSETSLEMTEPLAHATTHYWRVRAVNNSGAGPWSVVRRFTTARSSVSSDQADTDLPLQSALLQNYPNPLSLRTEIRYELTRETQVRLVLHDILGRAVATLVDGVQSAGRHSLTFDAGELRSGVYVYRISAGPLSASRTMTVLK